MVSFKDLKSLSAPQRSALVCAIIGLFAGFWGFWGSRNNVIVQVNKPAAQPDPKEVEFQQGVTKLIDLLNNKFYKEAEELAEKILPVHSHNTQVLSMLALSQHKLSQLDKAESNLRIAIEFQPGEWVLHHNLGNVLFEAGKTDEALTSFDKALELSPDNPKILLSHARSLEALGRYSEACNYYNKAADLANTDASLKVIIKNRVKKLDVLAYLEKEKQ